MDNKPEMSYQYSGYKMVFFLEHQDKQNIEDYYNLFWSHTATSGKLYWVHDHRAYFWTSEESMKRALASVFVGRIMELPFAERKRMFKDESGAGRKLAESLADEAFEKILRIAGAFSLRGKGGSEYSVKNVSIESYEL